jgi:hypothetical protein
MLSGCNQPPNKLSGDWGIAGAENLVRKLGEAVKDQNSAESAESDEDESQPKMILQFRSSGSLRTTTKLGRMDPPPKEGKWKMVSWDETKQVMSIQCTLGDQTTDHEVRFIEPDLIELIPPNMAGTSNRIKFRRMK